MGGDDLVEEVDGQWWVVRAWWCCSGEEGVVSGGECGVFGVGWAEGVERVFLGPGGFEGVGERGVGVLVVVYAGGGVRGPVEVVEVVGVVGVVGVPEYGVGVGSAVAFGVADQVGNVVDVGDGTVAITVTGAVLDGGRGPAAVGCVILPTCPVTGSAVALSAWTASGEPLTDAVPGVRNTVASLRRGTALVLGGGRWCVGWVVEEVEGGEGGVGGALLDACLAGSCGG
ncbi:hypothetical protein [Nocardiopsis quinghaiensis]|uniref:hypothetical protein n=1 Tax=Nocardiopsis quinghaiensis TaxID=464995 RepID=UPI001CC236DC|nr:hypothetical protein [Nocardiopsis quinghaiensis]